MIRTAEPNDYAAEILFYLPLAADPRLPKTAHVFVLGEVRVKPPGGVWVDVALDHIVERGRGWYAIRLTTLQRATAGVVAYEAACSGAQPDRGTEIIGSLGGDILEGGTGLLVFYLPNELDPIYGAPVEGHSFTLGEVEVSLPDDSFGSVSPSAIVELGGGMYGVSIDASQSTKRGKAIVVANVSGAQRYSGYSTILGDASLAPPGPTPVPPLPPPSSAAVISTPGISDGAIGDLRLVWSNVTGNADLELDDLNADLFSDRGLMTAVLLSLFLDRRAENDDTPPSGDPRDRRGWWGDQFAEVAGDRYGSRLWLLDRAKMSRETVLRAREYCREALAWMLEDRVASSVDIGVEAGAREIVITGGLQRPGRDPVNFRFAHTWDHLQESA